MDLLALFCEASLGRTYSSRRVEIGGHDAVGLPSLIGSPESVLTACVKKPVCGAVMLIAADRVSWPVHLHLVTSASRGVHRLMLNFSLSALASLSQ